MLVMDYQVLTSRMPVSLPRRTDIHLLVRFFCQVERPVLLLGFVL